MSDRHVTINIGPQNSESWFFIAVAIAVLGWFWFMAHLADSKPERAKVETHAKP